jgi:hypothetical protein
VRILLTGIFIHHIATVKAKGRLKPIRCLKLREGTFLNTSVLPWKRIHSIKRFGDSPDLLSRVGTARDVAQISISED